MNQAHRERAVRLVVIPISPGVDTVSSSTEEEVPLLFPWVVRDRRCTDFCTEERDLSLEAFLPLVRFPFRDDDVAGKTYRGALPGGGSSRATRKLRRN